MSELLLPDNPLFDLYLGSLPPNWKEYAFKHPDFALVARPGSYGLLVPVHGKELDDYLYGGEFDARSEELEADWDD